MIEWLCCELCAHLASFVNCQENEWKRRKTKYEYARQPNAWELTNRWNYFSFILGQKEKKKFTIIIPHFTRMNFISLNLAANSHAKWVSFKTNFFFSFGLKSLDSSRKKKNMFLFDYFNCWLIIYNNAKATVMQLLNASKINLVLYECLCKVLWYSVHRQINR